MAYKQTPGRSPFLKTGRGIPLNFLSPLYDHKPGHPKEDKPPSVTKETLNITNTGGGESSSDLSTSNLQDLQSTKIDKGPDFKPTQEQTNQANLEIQKAKELDIKNKAINESNKSESSKNISSGSKTVNVSDKSDADIAAEGNVAQRNIENTALGYQNLANQYAAADSSATAQGYLSKLPMYQQLEGSPQYKQAGILGTGAAYLQRVGSGGFSGKQAISKSGQSKMNIRSGIESLITGDNPKITSDKNFGGPVSNQLNIDAATPKEVTNLVQKGKDWRKAKSSYPQSSVNKLTGRNLNQVLNTTSFNKIIAESMKKK